MSVLKVSLDIDTYNFIFGLSSLTILFLDFLQLKFGKKEIFCIDLLNLLE